MSASLPKTRRNDATIKEKADAGHVLDAVGMLSSLERVGNMTVNPETKNSERSCDIDILNTKPISFHSDGKISGLALPSLSTRS